MVAGCDHAICLECIRDWRKSGTDNKKRHSCPVCRIDSTLVIPSAVFATGKEKNEIRATYLTRLSSIPCKYFKRGYGRCRFAPDCNYAHLYPDGSLAVDANGLQSSGCRAARPSNESEDSDSSDDFGYMEEQPEDSTSEGDYPEVDDEDFTFDESVDEDDYEDVARDFRCFMALFEHQKSVAEANMLRKILSENPAARVCPDRIDHATGMLLDNYPTALIYQVFLSPTMPMLLRLQSMARRVFG